MRMWGWGTWPEANRTSRGFPLASTRSTVRPAMGTAAVVAAVTSRPASHFCRVAAVRKRTSPSGIGEQAEGLHVPGSDDAEVPVVEGGHLALAQPLAYRHNRCIDEPQREVGVLPEQHP